MATTKLFNLPTVPSALKNVTPYLQRAHELKGTEPIMSYWCTYYAAQVGIALNVKEARSREFLFDLLGLLESMKETIGPSDAIDVEAVSAAYVENFALKIFTMADNEDRKGAATRSTAKKFLAAANFLEVLKTFPQSELSEPHDEKTKYAKWKAADIGKALREGRKPVAGPANANPELESKTLLLDASIPQFQAFVPEDLPPALRHSDTPISPSWSTAATPGISTNQGTPLESGTPSTHPGPNPLIDVESDTTESIFDGDLGGKEVHFSSSVTEGSSTTAPSVVSPPAFLPSAPPQDPIPSQSAPPVASAPSLEQITEPELTPAIIKQAQKHCRYAISALDYEDRAQARKELLAALKVLE